MYPGCGDHGIRLKSIDTIREKEGSKKYLLIYHFIES